MVREYLSIEDASDQLNLDYPAIEYFCDMGLLIKNNNFGITKKSVATSQRYIKENATVQLMSTNDLVRFTNKRAATIDLYIKKGYIAPETNSTKKRLYTLDAAIKLSRILKKPGKTIQEVAALIGKSSETVKNYIKRGDLKGKKQKYMGKERYFIDDSELRRFLDLGQRTSGKSFYTNDGYYLGQKIEVDKKIGKITEIENGIAIIRFCDGHKKPVESINMPKRLVNKNMQKHYISQKGYAKFCFSKSNNIDDPFFNFFAVLYNKIGPKNIWLYDYDDEYILKIKPCTIPVTNVDLEYIINSIHLGSVEKIDNDHLRISSHLQPVVVHINNNLKKSLSKEAKLKNFTLEEYILYIIDTRRDT